MSGVILDTGALIALERESRERAVIIAEARTLQATMTVPAACVAQVWRSPARQARVASFLRLSIVDVVALDAIDARRVGRLLAAAGANDVVDGHVALCGHRLDQPVITSDPDDITKLAPGIRIHMI